MSEEKLTEVVMIRLSGEKGALLKKMAHETHSNAASIARGAVELLLDHYVENGYSITYPLRIKFEPLHRAVADEKGNSVASNAPRRSDRKRSA